MAFLVKIVKTLFHVNPLYNNTLSSWIPLFEFKNYKRILFSSEILKSKCDENLMNLVHLSDFYGKIFTNNSNEEILMIDDKEKEESKILTDENENENENGAYSNLFDFKTDTPSSILIKIDTLTFKNITENFQLLKLTEILKKKKSEFTTSIYPDSYLNKYFNVFFTNNNKLNDDQKYLNVTSSNSINSQCDIDWIIKIKNLLFLLFLKLFYNDNLTQINTNTKSTKTNDRNDSDTVKSNTAWLLSYSFCALLCDILYVPPQDYPYAQVNFTSNYRNASKFTKMNSHTRKSFLTKTYEKIKTLLITPLTDFTENNEKSLPYNLINETLLSELIFEVSVRTHKNVLFTKLSNKKNNIDFGWKGTGVKDSTSNKTVSKIKNLLLFLMSDVTVSKIQFAGISDIIYLKNQKIALDILLKSFYCLKNSKVSLHNFTTKISNIYLSNNSTNNKNKNCHLNTMRRNLFIDNNDKSDRLNYFDRLSRKINFDFMRNFKEIFRDLDNITINKFNNYNNINYSNNTDNDDDENNDNNNNNKIIDIDGNNNKNIPKFISFLNLLNTIISLKSSQNSVISSLLPDIHLFIKTILTCELNEQSISITLVKEKEKGRETTEKISEKTEEYLIIQLLRDLYYKTECSTKSIIKNKLCQVNKSIVNKNISAENDTTNLFDNKKLEIYNAMKNHLKLLFVCYEKNGIFLCPVVKNLLSSTSIMEASVASKTGSFTLGTYVRCMCFFYTFENVVCVIMSVCDGSYYQYNHNRNLIVCF